MWSQGLHTRIVRAEPQPIDHMCILTLNGAKDRSGLPAQPARSAAHAGHPEPCKQASLMRSHVSAHMRPDSPALTRQPTPAGRAAPPRDGAHSYEIHGTQKRVPPKHREVRTAECCHC